MAQWPALYGVFRHDDDESRLIEGVKAVLNGEQSGWIERDAPGDDHAADHAIDSSRDSPLTERECEILNELRCGATRRPGYRPRAVYRQNTVRTHMCNVVSRKLSVKNRTQAVSWAGRTSAPLSG